MTIEHLNSLNGRRPIGYWRWSQSGNLAKSAAPSLPDPKDFIDPSWDPAERDQVIAYLESGQVLERWRGYSNCRICGCLNGTTCKGDDAYNWPEGFAHYLKLHGVRPPDEFIAHCLGRLASFAPGTHPSRACARGQES